MKEFKYVVTDNEGIHARPAGELVKLVKGFESKITIEKDGKTVECSVFLSMKKPFRILLRKHFPKTVLPFIHMMIFTPMYRRFPKRKRYFFPEAM